MEKSLTMRWEISLLSRSLSHLLLLMILKWMAHRPAEELGCAAQEGLLALRCQMK